MEEIILGSSNVRTLKREENFLELEEAFEEGNIDILGLAEIRREGECIIETKKVVYFATSDGGGGEEGGRSGFLITKRKWKNK